MTVVRPLRRLLIANRGEIAVRIARAARAAGIAPLGVYSDADRDAYHVSVMDDAVRIGPAAAAESYLALNRILAAARELGADAVHPGYGFLSERAPFAAAVAAAGLVFVGPPAAAIAAMGDKAQAKQLAREHDVPVVPGYDGDDDSEDRLLAEARRIGLPLLIKATAGGGGRGMRVVRDLAELADALAAARREAQAAFGDARVLLERYVEQPRHIEFQILADAFGTVLDLGERDCSIQRRHQKIVEEAPAPGLDGDLRERMGAAALRAARAVGYVNAGTVEFLVDPAGAFYFLEMNARLQVEHPVTEAVRGLDLVRWQLAIAAGEALPAGVAAAAARFPSPPAAVAIEVRITAEDPVTGFPATGTIARFEPPAGEGLRLDAGVRTGSRIGIDYDSLIAKLIVSGPDRTTAVRRLAAALETFTIEGVKTNLAALSAIARDPVFRDGRVTTAFLTERGDALAAAADPAAAVALAIAAVASDPRAWRLGGVGIRIALVTRSGTIRVVASRAAGERFQVSGDRALTFSAVRRGDHVVVVRDAADGGERIAGTAVVDPAGVTVGCAGETYRFGFEPPPQRQAGAAAGSGGSGAIAAPMPGKILQVYVAAGDTVAERDVLVVLEAMKMEHRVVALQAGRVRAVYVAAGALVAGGAPLVEIGEALA